MSLGTRVSGAWKNISAVSVKVNGAWKTCKQVYVKVSGAWKPCIFTSESYSVAAPIKKSSSVTLSDAKIGTYIKITGTITVPTGGDGGATNTYMGWDVTNTDLGSCSDSKTLSSGQSYNFDCKYRPNVGDPSYLKVTAVPVKITPWAVVSNYDTWFSNVKVTYTREGYFD